MGLTIRILTFTCLLIAAAATFVQAARTKRLIKGEGTELKNVRCIASIREVKGGELVHFCGGAIISKRHILTAAHCVDDQTAAYLNVLVGTTDLKSKEKGYGVKKIHVHKNYKGRASFFIYDIAILTLISDLKPSPDWQPIKLASKEYPAETPVLTAGWGYTKYDVEKYSEKLLHIRTKLAVSSDCKKDINKKFNEGYQLCFLPGKGVSGEKGVCKGDSGGPLIANEELIGIASFTNVECGKHPSIFAKVWAFDLFIEEITGIKMKPR